MSSRVTREQLEQEHPLAMALDIVGAFYHDRDAYPHQEFILRDGICKDLAEEYAPLVTLAQAQVSVAGIRLLASSNPGPDACISFEDGSHWMVQITCAHEDYERALSRERISLGEITGTGEHFRDPATGRAEWRPQAFLVEDDIAMRVGRIAGAVRTKLERYREGTDTLLVVDAPAGFDYLEEGSFRERTRQAVLELDPARYRRIWAAFGEVPFRLFEAEPAHRADGQ